MRISMIHTRRFVDHQSSMFLKTWILVTIFALFFGLPDILLADDVDTVKTTVNAWRSSWENKDIVRYKSFYSRDFKSGTADYNSWVNKKTALFKNKGPITIVITDPEFRVVGRKASVIFNQAYTSGVLSDMGTKKLILVKTGNDWKIVSEQWERLDSIIRTTGKTSGATDTAEDIVVEKIAYRIGTNGTERVCLGLTQANLPEILALEGPKPRIAIDIISESKWTGPGNVPVEGVLIKQIRTHFHSDSKKLRIVLDLEPARDYSVNPAYYKAENIYCVEIEDAGAIGSPDGAENTAKQTAKMPPKPKKQPQKQTAPIQSVAPGHGKSPENPAIPGELLTFLDNWKTAWEKTAGQNGDMTAYMSFYSEHFKASGHDKASWRRDKNTKNSKRRWIRGKLSHIDIIDAPNSATVKLRFNLDYKAPNYSEVLKKTIILDKEPGGWKIVSEKTRLATGRYSSKGQ